MFWGALPKETIEESLRIGELSVHYSGRKWWGLRESPEEAVKRARSVGEFPNSTHVFFQVRFTPLGHAVLTQKLVTGWPLMYLKQESVWHCNGNISLDLVSDEGETYIEVAFVEIS